MDDLRKLTELLEVLQKREDQQVADFRKQFIKPNWQEQKLLEMGDIPIGSDSVEGRVRPPNIESAIEGMRNERLAKVKIAEDVLKERGYERYAKKGTRGRFDMDIWKFKNPSTGKVLRSLPYVGAATALASPSLADAAVDMIVPAGVDPVGQGSDQVYGKVPESPESEGSKEYIRLIKQRMK